jgi:hypothetical protein
MNVVFRVASVVMFVMIATTFPVPSYAESAQPVSALAKMPVKEITVFKDGHAFVLHEGDMPTDKAGDVVMDYLPYPVLGTFWPFSSEKGVRLSCAVASKHRVSVPRTALALDDLLEANPGAAVHISEITGSGQNETVVNYDATVIGVPTRSSKELEETSPPNQGEKLPEKGRVILLKTAEGTRAVSLDRIQDVTFKQDHESLLANEEFRNLLTLKLNWGGHKPATSATVGMMYLQKGVRWIPSYKVALDDNGNAKIKLQATLINELTDLEDVTANLVIGVPSFAFKDNTDPIAIQEAVAALSPYFAKDDRTANRLSNAIMSQVAYAGAREEAGKIEQGADLGPEISGSAKNEDLFVYTVKHISMKKGQRMVVPVVEFELPFSDLYTLDLPITPPPEVHQFANNAQAEAEKMLNAPKVMHKIKLTNNSQYPLTTAPALILHGDRVLAQGTMTYAAPGGDEKIDITSAVNIKAKKTDKETSRVPNAANMENYQYARVDLTGTISLTNFNKKPVDLEVTRRVLGKVTKADHQGVIEMINVFEDEDRPTPYPIWWNYYNWPAWWHHVNGLGSIKWKFTLEPEKSIDLNYNWSYYWR